MFVHLNNHSDYSLRHSISTIEKMLERVSEIGQDAIALTDEGNLFAAVEFSEECNKKNIKPIIGCELTVDYDSNTVRNYDSGRILLLAKDDWGYENLKQLSSIAYLKYFYYYPRVPIEELERYNNGLFCIIPQRGSIVEPILEKGQVENATEKIALHKDIFKENVFLEIQNHGLSLDEITNSQINQIASQLSIPLVAGNACYYPRKEDAAAHEVLVQDVKVNFKRLPNDQFYIKSQDEMENMFSQFPEALHKTVEIAQSCNFKIKFIGAKLPNFPIPSNFNNQAEYLRHLTMEGIKERYSNPDQRILTRVNYELDSIISMGFSGYFLIIWDIIAYARKNEIPVGLGRGSAVGSIVAYALGITGIDPLKYGLLFERFLNPERISMPDIDTDFCFDNRQHVINYIRSRYGEDHCGQIITFSSLKPKGAVRDVGRALEIPLEEVNEIAKMLPAESTSIKQALEEEPRLSMYKSSKYLQLFDTTNKLLGVKRHASIHAAGVVIGTDKLMHFAPLYKDIKTDAVATQFSMNYLEKVGLVKMDILGLKNVTIIHETVKLVQDKHPEFTLNTIPANDKEVFAMLSQGSSEGVFQFESDGMQRALQAVKPERIEDLIALNALYRPGPMKYIEEYALVKNKVKPPSYLHPLLEPILKETYGVIVYQEQVMQIAQLMGGFSLGKADILRKAMGKKQKDLLEEMEKKFLDGAAKKDIDEKTAMEVFNKLLPFAKYGFNKSHAAAYAELAYQTAYLKCKFPLQYMVSTLNANKNKTDELQRIFQLCKKLRVKVLPPNINESDYKFTIQDGKIRFGICALKNLTESIKRHIPENRKKNGKYKSVLEVLLRLPDQAGIKTLLEVAIPTGLFDCIYDDRALLFSNIEHIREEGRKRRRANQEKQILLFVESDAETDMQTLLVKKPAEKEMLVHLEREYLGTYFRYNPLDDVKKEWRENTTINLNSYSRTHTWEGRKRKYYLIAYAEEVLLRVAKKKNRDGTMPAENVPGNDFLICTGVLHDYLGSIHFIHYAKGNANVDIPEQKPFGFYGTVYYREGIYTFKIIEAMSIPMLIRKRKHDWQSGTPLDDGIKRQIKLSLAAQTCKEDLATLKKTMMQHFGSAKVQFIIDNGDSTHTTVSLPPGFTVDANNKSFISLLKKNSIITSVQ